MKVCIHRGSKQIGGNCVEVEQDGMGLLIDLGLPLDATSNDKKYLPAIEALNDHDLSLLGILISHPHLDHFGLLSHISKNIPVGMGEYARQILTAAAPFLPNSFAISEVGWSYRSHQTFEIPPFKITPFLVDHSAYDSYALLIESSGKKLFYSGDFRAHGRKAALVNRLIEHPPCDIDALLVEGSSLSRLDINQQFSSEHEIETQLVQAFSTTQGLALVHTSVQNIDRIVSILRACKRTGRKLVIDLYSAVILAATGNQNIPQSDWSDIVLFVPHSQRIQVKKNAWFELLQKHSKNRIFLQELKQTPEKFTLLFRPLHCNELSKTDCLSGASYIYSQWEGYWENGIYDKVKNWLAIHNISKQSIHTSGHASSCDLKRFVEALAPKKVIPIHSFMPERYADLFANVEQHRDGEWWEI
jgi:ribonuclease J